MTTRDILKQAKKAGLCADWQRDFQQDHTMQNLCTKYFEGLDWALENDFPSIETLREFKKETEDFGLFTDYDGMISTEMKSEPNQFAFFGNSTVDIDCTDYSVSEIVIRHNAKARILARENCYVIVNIVDNGEAQIECLDEARVTVYDYGKRTRIKTEGNVSVIKSDFEQ